MHYQVRFVEDSELPSGVEFVFARVADGTYLFMKRSAILYAAPGKCEALTRSFSTWERAHSVELQQLPHAV